MTILEYQNIKIFWQKAMFEIEEVFVFKKVKNTVPSTNFITDLNGEEIVGMF